MSILIDGITSGLLAKALDVCTANHKVIANNIANVDSQDFTAKRLNFDLMMHSVNQAVLSGDSQSIKETAQNIDTTVLPVTNSDLPVELDVEMVELTNNTLRYQALVDMRSGLGNLLSTAISGSVK